MREIYVQAVFLLLGEGFLLLGRGASLIFVAKYESERVLCAEDKFLAKHELHSNIISSDGR